MKTKLFEEFLRNLVSGLNKSRVHYALTGALASSYYGIPRTTIDADVIVSVSEKQVESFIDLVEGLDLKVDRKAVRRRISSGYKVVTLRDKSSPYQVDFILAVREKVERRAGTLLGLRAYFQAPESLILTKLRIVKATVPRERSLKDRDDIVAILAHTRVDRKMIASVAKRQTTIGIFRALTGKS